MYYLLRTLIIALGISGMVTAQSLDVSYAQGFHFGKYNKSNTYNSGALFFIPDPDFSSADYLVEIPKSFQSETFMVSGIIPVAHRIGIRVSGFYQRNGQYILTDQETYKYHNTLHQSYGLNAGVDFVFINKPGIRVSGFYQRGADYIDFGISNLTPFQQQWLKSWGMKGFAMSHTLGAEAEFAVSQRMSMTFQLRYHGYNYVYSNNTTTGLLFKKIDNQFAPGISLRYHFGKDQLKEITEEDDYFEGSEKE